METEGKGDLNVESEVILDIRGGEESEEQALASKGKYVYIGIVHDARHCARSPS